MIVDINSLDQAVTSLTNNSNLLNSVNKGDFKPGTFSSDGSNNGFPGSWPNGNYPPGLQTVGEDNGEATLFTPDTTVTRINSDGFLAYAVQAEEDRINKKIRDMHLNATNTDIYQSIDNAITYNNIRSRDDLLMQKADAQAGRVLKDRNGNWVRVGQYIHKGKDSAGNDNRMVQVLNVRRPF